ncbi:MAG: hypothetical protein AB1776_03930 [Bacillota bacterium]
MVKARKKSISLLDHAGIPAQRTAAGWRCVCRGSNKFSSAYPIIDDAANQPAGWIKMAEGDQKFIGGANWITYVTIDLSAGAEWLNGGVDVDTTAEVQALCSDGTVTLVTYDADRFNLA